MFQLSLRILSRLWNSAKGSPSKFLYQKWPSFSTESCKKEAQSYRGRLPQDETKDTSVMMCNDADNDMNNDELTGTIHESSARISPRYNSIKFSNTEQ